MCVCYMLSRLRCICRYIEWVFVPWRNIMLEVDNFFCKAVVTIFGLEYDRHSTPSDVTRICEQNVTRSFLGMLGIIDCMYWRWKNCPTAWHGLYTGHKNASMIILEVVTMHRYGIPSIYGTNRCKFTWNIKFLDIEVLGENTRLLLIKWVWNAYMVFVMISVWPNISSLFKLHFHV